MASVYESDNYVSSSNILCLDIDCLEEIFEWLSLRDLRTLRASCKRMRLAADYYIKTTYPKRFGKYTINDSSHRDLRALESNLSKLFNHLELGYYPLCDYKSERFTNLFNQIEKLSINSLCMGIESYRNIFQACKNLKWLNIRNYGDFITTDLGYEWLLHAYPTLQHLSLLDDFSNNYARKMVQLETFFHLNPNVRQFSTESYILNANESWLLTSDIKLDQLDIRSTNIPSNPDFLNLLHEQGFYKRLYLYIYTHKLFKQTDLDRLASLKALEKLSLFNTYKKDFIWPRMTQVKEVTGLGRSFCVTNSQKLVTSFPNIERVYLECANFNIILPFIQHSTKLKELKINVKWLLNDNFINKEVVDLPALNKERQKCENATKITIYINEEVYLKTKRAFGKTDFPLIELKRANCLGARHLLLQIS